ncbi:hypothetical protein NH340_JMT02399 [Sarcoptes scabiei]|nr:hypothetical protein NH340_JMT02399 [Sarcoptes scabiei]
MTICDFFQKFKSKFSFEIFDQDRDQRRSSLKNGQSCLNGDENRIDENNIDLVQSYNEYFFNTAIISDFVVIEAKSKNLITKNSNEFQRIAKRYYSIEFNKRPNKLDLNLNISREYSIASKKSLVLNEIERTILNSSENCPSQSCDSQLSCGSVLQNICDLNLIPNSTLIIEGHRYIHASENDFRKTAELGSGNYGYVQKFRHLKSETDIAIKRMRFDVSNFDDIRKHIKKDLEFLSKSNHQNIIKFYGCFFTTNDSELWLCLELMTTCFDHLIKSLQPNLTIPEVIIGSATVSIVEALIYMKQTHNIIHRDIKPSNILINRDGQIKLCDFGVSGHLQESITISQTMGSLAYQAPERIQPNEMIHDVRVDVWSLGLTMLEMALGYFPYRNWSTSFEIVTKILNPNEVPTLNCDSNYSINLKKFIDLCLIHDYRLRPKYNELVLNPFYIEHHRNFQNKTVSDWFNYIYQKNQ